MGLEKHDIKVSVCVVTYNQERYIGQCLQSLVNQKTNFDFEILVADDCSTDNTRAVIQNYVAKYKSLIQPLYHAQNLGPMVNLISAYRTARGAYIAHMDGDDYALPGKLQQQYDALVAHPECVICMHNVIVIDKNGDTIRSSYGRSYKCIYTRWDFIINRDLFIHSSKMFVNDLSLPFWDAFTNANLDMEINSEQTRAGNIYYLSNVLGAYRIDIGITLDRGKLNANFAVAMNKMYKEYAQECARDRKKSRELKRAIAKTFFGYAYTSAKLGDPDGLRKYIDRSIEIALYSPLQLAFFVIARFPSIAIAMCRGRSYVYNHLRRIASQWY